MVSKAGEEAQGVVAQPTALGVVIQVPSPLDTTLRGWRRRYGGNAAAAIAPHITLVSGSTTDWDSAVRHVRKVAARMPVFRVELHGTGTFRPISPVVFMNVTEGAQACARLHDELVDGPLRHELSYGYHPHLTIAHEVEDSTMDLARDELADESMAFAVDSIGLFGIDSTGAWSLREELELGGPAR